MTLTREHLIYAAIAVLLFGGLGLSFFVPSLGVSGGDNSNNLLVISLAAFVFAFFVHGSATSRTPEEKDSHPIVLPRLLLILSGLFVIMLYASILVAYDIHSALLSALEWSLAVLLMVVAACWVQMHPKSVQGLSSCMVIGAALLSIAGLFTFTDNLGYLHLTSLFPEHNPFGGYLSMLIPASFVLSMSAKRPSVRTAYTAATILISTAFVLTFSRGSWLCFIVAVVAGLAFYRKELSAMFTRDAVRRAFAVLIGTALLSGAMYALAKEASRIESTTSTVYSDHVVPTDSAIDRLYYFEAAVQVIELHPLGVGMGNYPIAAQALRTSVLHFAFDPHDIYLRMAAETGIIGGFFFIVFLLYAYGSSVADMYRVPLEDRGDRLLLSAISIGILAELLHSTIDFDLNYPLVIFTLFLLLGILYGASISNPRHIAARALPESSSLRWIGGVVGGIALITAFFALEFVSNQALTSADNLVVDKKYDAAIPLYQRAEMFDPIQGVSYVNESNVYYTFATVTSGDARTHFADLGLSKLSTSLRYDSQSADAYTDEAYLYQLKGDLPDALAAMKKAVAADPTNNLDRHIRLLSLYADTHDYADALALIQATVQKFPPELFTDYRYGDPSKELWKSDIVTLLKVQKAIYVVSGEAASASSTDTMIQRYEAIP